MASKKNDRPALGRGLSALMSAPAVALAPRASEPARHSAQPAPFPSQFTIPTPVQAFGNTALQEFSPPPTTEGEADQDRRITYLPLQKLVTNPSQPRQSFSETDIRELAESIKTLGLLQPILVRPQPSSPGQMSSGLYEIVAGERRYRASKELGASEVPVIIEKLSDREALEIAIVENVQRQNLNPVEEATAYKRLCDEFSLSQAEVAERVGKDRASITNFLRLLTLCEPVLEQLREGQITMGHAKVLLSIKEQSAQISLARKIIAENLSVRALESIISQAIVLDSGRRSPGARVNSGLPEGIPPETLDRMRQALGTKVTLKHHRSGRGKIEIEYFSTEELDRIVDQICKG